MNRKKLNDKIKREKKLRNEMYVSDEAKEVKRFAFILIGVIVVVLIVYGLTIVFKKNDNIVNDDIQEGTINYNVVSVGTMLNKADSEYYVILFDNENPNATYYNTLASLYSKKENALKVYTCDLGNKLNKDYVAEYASNPKATSVEDFAFGEVTLVRVKNGRIIKYVETVDTIKKELGL